MPHAACGAPACGSTNEQPKTTSSVGEAVTSRCQVMSSKTPDRAEMKAQRRFSAQRIGVTELPEFARTFEPKVAFQCVGKAQRLSDHVGLVAERAHRSRGRAATPGRQIAHVASPKHAVEAGSEIE